MAEEIIRQLAIRRLIDDDYRVFIPLDGSRSLVIARPGRALILALVCIARVDEKHKPYLDLRKFPHDWRSYDVLVAVSTYASTIFIVEVDKIQGESYYKIDVEGRKTERPPRVADLAERARLAITKHTQQS